MWGMKFSFEKQIGNLGKVQCPTQGPFMIMETHALPFNSTVLINNGSYKGKTNIHHILPFFHNPVEDANAIILP